MGMIQIRNVPDDLHRTLKMKAAKAGLSLSDYLLDEARRLAERLTWEEVFERVRSQPVVEFTESSADIIRELRGPLGPPQEEDRPLTTVEIIRQMRGPLPPE